MPEQDFDVDRLARHLGTAIASFDRLVAAKAKERSDKICAEYAKAADERTRADREAARVEIQRLQDLVAEYRRQREPLERAADKSQRIATVVRRAHWAGEEAISVKALMDIINEPERERA